MVIQVSPLNAKEPYIITLLLYPWKIQLPKQVHGMKQRSPHRWEMKPWQKYVPKPIITISFPAKPW